MTYEQHWQYLTRYQVDDPEIQLIKSLSLYRSGTGEDFTTQFDYAAQHYGRTNSVFNGKYIWQGVKDPEVFLVYANIPVSITEGAVSVDSGITRTHLFVTPDNGGSVIKQGWKLTKAADIPSIQDGIVSGDLFRGSFHPLRKHPNLVLGFVDGGDTPIPGVYFEGFVINDAQNGITETPRFSMRHVRACTNAGYPEAHPLLVNSLVDLSDALAKADAACAEIGEESVTFVTEVFLDDSPRFLVEGYSCCFGPVSEPSSEESSSG